MDLPKTDFPKYPYWVSVHDVMPDTLSKTLNIVECLKKQNVHQVTLLVVPGKQWSGDDIQALHHLQNAGHELAGHGWVHHVDQRDTLYHKLHGALISRHVAEHLSLPQAKISHLIQSCYQWFSAHRLQRPDLYVPPAWAMGRISRETLRQLPFQRYEYLNGIYHAPTNCFEYMALLGFEADTRWRRAALRLNNRINQWRSKHRTCRIAIHPDDLNLLMRSDIDRLFAGATS